MIEQNVAATEILFRITGEIGPGLIFVKKTTTSAADGNTTPY